MTDAKITVVLIGDGGVGKTAFCKSVTGHGEFDKKYVPTMGMETYSIKTGNHFHENASNGELVNIEFSLRDTCGQEKFGSLRDAYYDGADAAILVFDVTARVTYKNVPAWYKDFTKVCPKAVVVLVGNKVDYKDRKVKPRDIGFHRKKSLQYYELSVKTSYNLAKPIMYIARKCLNEPELFTCKCGHFYRPLKSSNPSESSQVQEEIETNEQPDAAPL